MNPSCAEAEMPDDGLATQGAMLIAAMVLTMEEKRVHVFHEKGFQLPVPFECWEQSQFSNMFFLFS